MTQDWYAPREVVFNQKTTLWLVRHLGTLSGGQWPPEASNYIDMSNRSRSRKPAFITPIEYHAEISTRLEQCGQDGLILEAVEGWGKTESSMASYLRMPVWSVRKRLKNALRYVSSGRDRRWHDTKKRKGKTYRDFIKKE